ncbi:TnsD family Tn7-like transposition protein [Psychrobacter sp.]|uniref:TniQ family protein n=1 Tax=Psychrobacter sp. TaxID=56811 RepID=UPI003C769606
MINFPMLYEEELIYSVVARAGVRAGITSPKQLLDDIFGNRKIIATIDLPNQLAAIIKLYRSQQYTVETLIYSHTLFPIYAPFIPEDRRKQCLAWMREDSQGSVHLAVGLNASRVPTSKKVRYCPSCFKSQLENFGECYWSRLWQVQGANCCLEHGSLIDSELDFRPSSRHSYVSADFESNAAIVQPPASKTDIFFTHKALELLNLSPLPSPSYEQWSLFYKNLALSANCNRGSGHINFDNIVNRLLARWSISTLRQLNLHDLDADNSWLRSIFRKHRKSFSYLEHLIVIEAFIGRDWSFREIIAHVSGLVVKKEEDILKPSDKTLSDIQSKREQWQKLLAECQKSIKQARQKNGRLYAWLYRHDKTWLLSYNRSHHSTNIESGLKHDWIERDKLYVRQLLSIKNTLIWDLDSPRRSSNWWLKQAETSSTVEKNLEKLPLVSSFLTRYSENVSDYQIRRLTRVYISRISQGISLSDWIILREAGLSEQRLTEEANRFQRSISRLIETENWNLNYGNSGPT